MVLTSHVKTAASTIAPTASTSQSDYIVTLYDGTMTTVKFEDLVKETSPTNPASTSIHKAFEGLPHFLRLRSKITTDHAGIFHKGFLGYTNEGGYTFDGRRTERSTKRDWMVPLSQFKQNWTNLVGNKIIILGHSTVSSFLKPSTSSNAPSTNFVSAKTLLGQYPSLFAARS